MCVCVCVCGELTQHKHQSKGADEDHLGGNPTGPEGGTQAVRSGPVRLSLPLSPGVSHSLSALRTGGSAADMLEELGSV